MAIEIIRPEADGSASDWSVFPSGGGDYTGVDEVTKDDDTSYIYRSGGAVQVVDGLFTGSDSIPVGAVINSVTVKYYQKRSASNAPTSQPIIKLSGGSIDRTSSEETVNVGNYDTLSAHTYNTKPGGGAWTLADVQSMEFGVASVGNGSLKTNLRITQLWLEVDYTAGSYQAPTSLEADRQTNPTNASELPSFTAIFNDSGATGTAVEAYVEVNDADDFSSPAWNSGWVSITGITDGQRSDPVAYNGSYLVRGTRYYWRIKFRDASLGESSWSVSAWIEGFRRKWHDVGFANRHLLKWDPATNPNGIPSGSRQTFQFKTGTRKKISENGYFNEAIQASGGWQVAYFNGKKYVSILRKSELSDGKAYAGVIQIDERTGAVTEVNTGMELTTSDTHNFPVICIDNNGYIYLFVATHQSQLYYQKSTNPEDVSSWGPKTAIASATWATYPKAFVRKANNRIYCFYRGDGDRQEAFVYSDDGGSTWSDQNVVGYDRHPEAHRIYAYFYRFDESNDRLYMGYTYTHFVGGQERSTGAWLIYSDHGETDGSSLTAPGFNLWRNMDGTLRCRTAIYDQYTTQQPFGYDNDVNWATEAGRAIQFYSANTAETDIIGRVFVMNGVVLSDGTPLVLYIQQEWDNSDGLGGLATQPIDIMAASWNGSSWTRKCITDDVQLRLRVGRSGVGVMVDRNGLIRMLMPVNGRPFHTFVPKQDHDSVGVTPSSGVDNYAMVDDGIAECDGEGTYLEIAAAGKASFSNQADSMRDAVDILAVQVCAEVKQSSASTSSATLYLDIGGTEYDGAALTIDNGQTSWFRHIEEWSVNPDTSLAWTKADVEGLQFGVKNTHGSISFLVTKMLLRVQWLNAGTKKVANSEVVELSSADGITWKFEKWITGASHQGQPIMTSKHHLTNQSVEIAWVQGTDIFLYSEEPFNLVQGDIRDARLYYGDSEIDRIADYGGMDKSEFEFKVQEAVAAAAEYGPKDLILYSNGPGITSRAQEDPDNVMLFHEGFELYDAGDSLNGKDSWVVNAGTATIVSSPPEHNNKLHSGNRAVEFTVIGTNASRSIGSGLQTLYLRCGIMVNGSTFSYTYVGFRNASGDIVGVGVNRNGSRPGIWKNGAWISDTSKTAYNTVPHVLEIFLTPYGVSYYVDGVELRFQDDHEVTSGGVDEVYLFANDAQAFIDSVEVRGDVGHADRIAGTLTDSSLAYEADNSATYNAADGKIESSQTGVRSVIVTLRAARGPVDDGDVHFRLHLCPEATYNAGNVIETRDVVIYNVNTTNTANHEGQITFHSLTAGQYSIKVDMFQVDRASSPANFVGVIAQADYMVPGSAPVIELQDTEHHGILMEGVLQGAGEGSFGMDGVIDGDQVTRYGSVQNESTAQVTRYGSVQNEHKTGISASKGALIEHLTRLEIPRAVETEALAAMAARSFGAQSESLTAVERLSRALAEQLSAVGRSAVVADEFLRAIGRRGQLGEEHHIAAIRTAGPELEHLIGVNRAGQVVVEQTGSILIERAASVQLEHLSTIDRPSQVNNEYLGTVSRALQLVTEGLAGIDRSAAGVIEYLSEISRAGSLSIESLTRIQVSKSGQLEQTAGVEREATASLEVLAGISRQAAAIVEWLGSVQVERAASVQIEHLSSIVRTGQTLTEGLIYVLAPKAMGAEALVAIERDASVVLEWAGAVAIVAPGAIQIEHLAGVSRSANVTAEHLRIVDVTGSVVTERLISAIRPASVATEHLLTTEITRAFNIPIETLQRLVVTKRAQTESLASIARSAAINTEYRTAVLRQLQATTEQTVSFTVDLAISTEELAGMIRQAGISVEWLGTLFTAVALCNVRLTAPTVVNVSLTAPELEKLRMLLPRIENLALNSPELKDLVLKSAEIINVELKGGCNE